MIQPDSHLMSPMDSAWLALERPGGEMMIAVLMRVEGLNESRFREFLERYWLAWQRFRFMPVQRPPGWWWEKDEAFSLSTHIEVVPGQFDERALQDWVSVKLNEPLPNYRPRWKFWLLPDAEGDAAVLLRIHHCYADGLSLVSLFDSLCPRSPLQAPVLYGATQQADLKRWTRAAGAWFERLVSHAEGAAGSGEQNGNVSPANASLQSLELAARRGMKLIGEVGQFIGEPEDLATSLRIRQKGRRHCRWSRPIALEDFRQIASNAGAKINDVLLGCVASAIRQHLADHGDELDESMLHAAVPVDIRAQLPDDLKPDSGALGNFFGTVFVPLPIDGNSPLERLFRVKHETRKLKKSWQAAISWALASSASILPEAWRQPLAAIFFHKASAVVSNVPGTREPRYLSGCKITEQMFWVPQAGDIGVGVSIVSYAGQVQFGVVADESVIPQPERFLNRCVEELGALKETCTKGQKTV